MRLLQTHAKESTGPSSQTVRLVRFQRMFTYFKANILYYVTNKGYHPAFMRVQQPALPEKFHRLGSERVGDVRKCVTHLEHLRPDHCWAVCHDDPGLLEGSNLVGSSTWKKYVVSPPLRWEEFK